jgi:hypothetical protein
MIIIFLFLLTTSAYADMSECSKTNVQDDKNYCMAKYAGSATFCDKIKGYERRTQCMRMVIAKQREAQYSTIRKPKEGE